MALKQIIGWFLVIAGLVVIVYGLYTSFQIFTGAKDAPEIFVSPQPSSTAVKPIGSLEAQAQEMVGRLLQEQLKDLLPADSITKSLNLVAWSIFTWILIMGGGQIASIGVKLLAK